MDMKLIEKDGIVYANSREVAEMIDKRHDNLCRDIENYIRTIGQNSKLRTDDFFIESSYTAGTGKTYKCYLLTKKGCDMVANKMTGEKGILFTATYINKFYEMEKQLANKSIVPMPNINNPDELFIRKEEVSIRKSELWMKLADRANIPEFKQIADTYAANTLAGKEVIALPEVNKKTFSATEIGNLLGVSANKIGKLSKQLGMKIPEYGKFFYDKARGCNKQVETFRYYENAIDVFTKALQEEH